MRRIKFRGKDIKNGNWVYGTLIVEKFNKKSLYYIVSEHVSVRSIDENVYVVEYMYEVVGETVGQFVGLYDVNEKEIYEGDIVKLNVDGYLTEGVVIYSNGCFMVQILKAPEESGISLQARFGLPHQRGLISVIGNIYDDQNIFLNGGVG